MIINDTMGMGEVLEPSIVMFCFFGIGLTELIELKNEKQLKQNPQQLPLHTIRFEHMLNINMISMYGIYQ